jgi:uncharacterized SAM-binding protein YcdF (DUF218 family)
MELLELTIRTLCDIKPETIADAAYLYGQTEDNQVSVLSAARKLIHENLARKIVIVDSGPKSGYPGYAVWKAEMLEAGIAEEIMETIDLRESNSLNTLIEANAMIDHVKQNGYTSVFVVASPFHQLRAFMTSVTAALNHYPQVRLYSYNGHPLSWLDTVVHSQGKTMGPRKTLIQAEYDRILRYQQKGDLASVGSVLRYLDNRDSD